MTYLKRIGNIEYNKRGFFSKQEYIITYYSNPKGGGFKMGESKAYVFHSFDEARLMSVLVKIADKLKIDLEDV